MKATYLLLFGGTVSATNVDKQIIPAIYITEIKTFTGM